MTQCDTFFAKARHFSTIAVVFVILSGTLTVQGQNYKTDYITPPPSQAPAPAKGETAPALAPAKQKNINDLARFIAGLPPESDKQLIEYTKAPEWVAYSNSMNNRWPHFDYVKLSQLRIWTAKEFAKIPVNAVFYPFSGPDFVYVYNYFPQADKYILCGLEPVGDIPSDEKLLPLNNSLGWLEASFKTLFNAGYFVTTDMGVQLKMSPLQGTLPIMCVMLSRSGCRITSIAANSGRAEIHFTTPKGGREKTLYYFCTDLSNGGFSKGSFLGFLRSVHPDTVYVKSASYLMHEDEFSAVRNYILNDCSTIVQDDSGVPLRYFDTKRWTLKLFGVYHPPLDIFAKYNQPDLADLYSKTTTTPMTFGAGYHWDYNDSNLVLATANPGKKSSKTVSSPPAATNSRNR